MDESWFDALPAIAHVKAMCLLWVLCDAANDDGEVWLSATTLAARTKLRHPKTIRRYLQSLEQARFIEDTKQRRRSLSDRGGAKVYRILFSEIEQPRDAESQSCEIGHSGMPDQDAARSGTSGPRLGTSGGGDLAPKDAHEAKPKPQTEAAGQRAAPDGSLQKISAADFRPAPELLAKLGRERPEIDMQASLARFRAWDRWKQRRTSQDWEIVFRDWIARETQPAPGAGPASTRSPDWIERRTKNLLRLPAEARNQQLQDDPVMQELFEQAGGPAEVAKLLGTDELHERWYRSRACNLANRQERA